MTWYRPLLYSATFLGLVCLGMVGCGDSSTKTTDKDNKKSTDAQKTKDKNGSRQAGKNVDLKTVELGQVLDFLKSQKGKVVVMDIWAFTWTSCKEEFPHLVEMHKELPSDKFMAVSLALDQNPDVDHAKSLGFLKEVKADFNNFQLKKSENGYSHWKFDALPAVLVVDQQGNEKLFKNDVIEEKFFTYKDVKKYVSQLLQK